MKNSITSPPPGVYHNIPAEEYHSWNAVSSSLLKAVADCPAQGKAYIDGLLDEDKPQFVVGTGAHAACLEPARFEQEFAIGPDVDLRTKAGKEQWEAFAQANLGKQLIRGADGEAILRMRKAVWEHQKAKAILARVTDVELSIVWQDEVTGLMCKARPDLYCGGIGIMPDFKTTVDSEPRAFFRHAYDYGYHIQLAHYRYGMRQLGLKVDYSPIIAVKKKPAHVVVVFNPTPAVESYGHSMWRNTIETWAVCLRDQEFPGYSDIDAVDLELPPYAKTI